MRNEIISIFSFKIAYILLFMMTLHSCNLTLDSLQDYRREECNQ